MPLNEPVPDIVLETKQDISLMTESNVDESSLSTLIAQDHPSKFLHSKDKLLPSTVTITMSPSNGQIDLSLAAKGKKKFYMLFKAHLAFLIYNNSTNFKYFSLTHQSN